MIESKYYLKLVSKIVKKNFDKDLEIFESEFKEAFVGSFRAVSNDIADEIFTRFVSMSNLDFKDSVYRLVNVIELFEENYDTENDPLNDDEWAFIKVLVNSSSEDLELETIKYIMQVMLDLGYI